MAFWQAQAVYSPKGNGGADYGKCHHLSNTVIDILLHPAHIAWSCMHPILFSPDQSNHLISEETNGTDLKQWEKIQALHSLPTTWSPIFQLSDTMLQVNQSSYGQCCRPPWTQHGAEHMHGWKRWIPNWQPTILHWYSPNSQPTMNLPCHVKPLARLQVEKLADCKDHHWWQEKPAQLMPQLSREPLQSKTASYDTWQWEHMRACYSSSQLWLSMMRPNSTGMEGGSPLVWTMLYPPLETARLQTYTWDGHLNNFMPWTTCNPDLDTRPPLTAHAMWNLWKGSNLLQSWKCTETSHHL